MANAENDDGIDESNSMDEKLATLEKQADTHKEAMRKLREKLNQQSARSAKYKQAINNLESVYNSYEEVTKDSVFKICDKPKPYIINPKL